MPGEAVLQPVRTGLISLRAPKECGRCTAVCSVVPLLEERALVIGQQIG